MLPRLRSRRPLGPLVALALAAIPSTVAAAEPEGYLVAPFTNASQVRSLDWTISALAATLADKLEAVAQLRPAYASSPLDDWPGRFDARKAADLARDAGARWVFAGTFSRPSWRTSITVRLLQLDGGVLKEVAVEQESGGRDEVVAVLDRALDRLLGGRGWAPGAEQAAALHRIPTRDGYAFTLFGRGLNALHGLSGPVDLELADKTLQRVTRIDPRFAEAHRMLARVHLARGDEGRAAGQLAHALDLRPDYFPALAGLARLYRADSQRPLARELADKALAQRPYDADMRLLLGTLEFEAGDLDKALANLLRVCELRPRSLPARRTLAQLHAARADTPAAAAELERVIELAPDDIEARMDLGAARMRLGNNELAAAVYEEVLRRQPRHLQAQKFLGDLWRRLGEPTKAITAYERVRHLAPDDPRPYFLLAAAYVEAGRDDRAAAILEDALQFRAFQGAAFTDLGALALRRGDLKRAEALLARAVARAPSRPKAHFNYALLLDATHQTERALGEARAAVELDPEEAEHHYLAGVICLRLGRLDDAKLAFAEALRLRPAYSEARHNLALLDDLARRYGAEHAGAGAQ